MNACSPIDATGHLRITATWPIQCFRPAYDRAVARWGKNARAIVAEVVGDLAPNAHIDPHTGAEHELWRRVELAVAVLLSETGVPTPWPDRSRARRPSTMPGGPAWILALTTGFCR